MVTSGAVITDHLVLAATRRQRVSDVLTDSARLGEFAAVFDSPRRRTGRPRVCTSMSPGSWRAPLGSPETGGMYRVAIEDVSAWTGGDFSYSDR